MDTKKILAIAAPAAGAYLGVTAASMVYQGGGLMAAIAGIAGAAVGLYVAGLVAGGAK